MLTSPDGEMDWESIAPPPNSEQLRKEPKPSTLWSYDPWKALGYQDRDSPSVSSCLSDPTSELLGDNSDILLSPLPIDDRFAPKNSTKLPVPRFGTLLSTNSTESEDSRLMPPPKNPAVPRTPSPSKFVFGSKFMSPVGKSTPRTPQTPDTPECQYPIKEHPDSDSDSSPERSMIPRWAQSESIARALKRQENTDPDRIFPDFPKTCDLEEVFLKRNKEYRLRTSSGDWRIDSLREQEEHEYKKKMGFLK
eukprot:TRINITY_DN7043_c0_g1_i1.p2 TRINITY_DN7043_c0_g1~~TRINITY_DN7043_c0_g1_i1.p2  ORF type:complete len:250 (-),score=45.20 TRINITY_DN7043_c0_g1_i1:50-799(-)